MTFLSLVGGHLIYLKGSRFHHPKKGTTNHLVFDFFGWGGVVIRLVITCDMCDRVDQLPLFPYNRG